MLKSVPFRSEPRHRERLSVPRRFTLSASCESFIKKMKCRTCNRDFDICPNTGPGPFFLLSVVFGATFAVLLCAALLARTMSVFVATGVCALGTFAFLMGADSKRRWAIGFNNNFHCPHCGAEYRVRLWSMNQKETW